MKFRTTRDFVIPAGTELVVPPVNSTRWGTDFEAVVAVDDDHTAYFSMDINEGVHSGLVEEAE